MDPVEHSDGEYASAPVRGDLVLAAPPLHDRKPTAQRRLPRHKIGDSPRLTDDGPVSTRDQASGA
jgi:hypothetical protein